MRIYLDHNATSPLRPEAREAMLDVLGPPSNPSSVHAEGRKARGIVEDARRNLAETLGVLPEMVTFTGVGTEANNLAVKGANVDRIVVSATEHPCIMDAAEATGKPVEVVPVNSDGVIDLEELEKVLASGRGKALVCVMLANNETGTIQPVREVVDIAAKHEALVHCDAVQAYGKIPVNFGLLGVDTMTLSAHKAGGPQGVGALIVRDGVTLAKQLHGGGQERGLRGGTENVAGIAGFAAAGRKACKLESDISDLRDFLESGLQAATPDIVIFSKGAPRLPNTSFVALPGVKGQTALMNLDLEGVAVSTGSACSSGKVTGSRVLHAMGVAGDLRECALRISLGWTTTRADIENFIEIWQRLAARRQPNAAA